MQKLVQSTYFILLLIIILPACSNLGSQESRINFINEHREELELAAEQLLNEEWTEETAQNFLNQKGIELGIHEVNKTDKVVSFMIEGMLDNCTGIAYSIKGQQGHICGGRTVDWEN